MTSSFEDLVETDLMVKTEFNLSFYLGDKTFLNAKNIKVECGWMCALILVCGRSGGEWPTERSAVIIFDKLISSPPFNNGIQKLQYRGKNYHNNTKMITVERS